MTVRFIPTHYGGAIYRDEKKIGQVMRVREMNKKPEYKFFADIKSFTWQEMDDIAHIVYEANGRKWS